MAPKESNENNKCFTDWCNSTVLLILMTNPFLILINEMLVFFGQYDTMWNAWMSMALLPPNVKAWNELRNKADAVYGVKEPSEINYEDWYNVRDGATAE